MINIIFKKKSFLFPIFNIHFSFQEHPDLIKDQFWDDLYPEIPYTEAAEEIRRPDPVIGAAANIEVRNYQYK